MMGNDDDEEWAKLWASAALLFACRERAKPKTAKIDTVLGGTFIRTFTSSNLHSTHIRQLAHLISRS
jgi:hypothetical protein